MKKISNTIKISESKLNSFQTFLSKAKFELLEIWTPDEGEEKQIWFNKELKNKVTIVVTKEEELVYTSKQIVTEVTDLWFELRAIRNVLEDYYLEPEVQIEDKNDNTFNRFNDKLEEYQSHWDENKKYMSKLYKKNIDPSILAFLDLEEADKEKLTN